jgi:hypothetical protein
LGLFCGSPNATGIDVAWLMSNDPAVPMISATGHAYGHADFKRQQATVRAPDASHYRWRESQVGVASDLLYRLLAASRLKGNEAVDGFMERGLKIHPQGA